MSCLFERLSKNFISHGFGNLILLPYYHILLFCLSLIAIYKLKRTFNKNQIYEFCFINVTECLLFKLFRDFVRTPNFTQKKKKNISKLLYNF